MSLLFLITFFAVFTQSLTGFGSGLVSMAIMPGLVGVKTAVPLVAMITGTLEVILLLRYREAFRFGDIWRMCLASIIAIPIGVWSLRNLSEQILLPILGSVMAGYAIYGLLGLRMPRLEHPAWAYVAGFFAGLLSGAYSVGGPPAIIYANCRGWSPPEYKSNLQGFFLVNDMFAIINHAFAGNLTPVVLWSYVWMIPAIIGGMLVGTYMDRFLDAKQFRKIVLVLLVVMGLRMILVAF